MKKISILSFVLVTSATAFAGRKLSSPVQVQPLGPGSSESSGSLGSTRNAAGTSGDIGCTVFSDFASCFADMPNFGPQAFCVTTDPRQLEIIRSLKSDSFLQFDSDKSSTCQNLIVRTSSFDEPKAP